MGIFGGSVTPKDLQFEADGIIRRLLSIEALLLEKERHAMGLTTDEDYKTWLRGQDRSLWGAIFKKNDFQENKEDK